MDEKDGVHGGERMHAELHSHLAALFRKGGEGMYMASEGEVFGVFTLPEELIWMTPGIIRPEDRYKHFSEATLYTSRRLAQDVTVSNNRKKPIREHVPGSMIMTINLAYPTVWGSHINAETHMQLAEKIPLIHQSRSVEVEGLGKYQQRPRQIMLSNEFPHPATVGQLQAFGNILGHVMQEKTEKEAIQAATTRPLIDLIPKLDDLRRF